MTEKSINELVPLMVIVGRRIRENHCRQSESHHYSLGQLETLRYLNEHKNSLMKDVADYLHITRPSATTLIESLVKSGNVERVMDNKDRRATRLKITKSGEGELKKKFALMTAKSREVLSKLTEEERHQLIAILRKLEKIYQ